MSRRELTRPGEGLVDRTCIELGVVVLMAACQHGLTTVPTHPAGPDDATRIRLALWHHAGAYHCACRFHLKPGGWES